MTLKWLFNVHSLRTKLSTSPSTCGNDLTGRCARTHTHTLLLAHMGALREAGGLLMPEQERLMI